jgi:hypothetical protein
VYLPIVPVIVDDKCEVYALLDSGSTNTFITQRLASRLNLKGTEVNYKMSTLGNSTSLNSYVVSINLKSVTSEQMKLNNVFIVPSIPAKYPSHQLNFQKYPYLADLPIKQVSTDTKVDVLIGMDNAHIIMPLEVR